jgi:YD repeat-containing protein
VKIILMKSNDFIIKRKKQKTHWQIPMGWKSYYLIIDKTFKDSQGRVTCIDQNGRKTETTYDVQGRTTSIKTPEGTVFYEYDKFGRQIRVSSDKGNHKVGDPFSRRVAPVEY